MKYFRKHPDMVVITNYPEGVQRIRHGRQTTPQQISKILVLTVMSALGPSKKTLLLTDREDKKQHRGFIMRPAWTVGSILSLKSLFTRLIYNHETKVICMLYHTELFGRGITELVTPILLLLLRLTGKRIVVVTLSTPKVSMHPTLAQTLSYFFQFGLYRFMAGVSQTLFTGEAAFSKKLGRTKVLTIPLTFRSYKERRIVGQELSRTLFPSPIANLGLVHMLKES